MKVTITMKDEVIESVLEQGKEENRNNSNMIETMCIEYLRRQDFLDSVSDDDILKGAIQQDSMKEQIAWGEGAKWVKEKLESYRNQMADREAEKSKPDYEKEADGLVENIIHFCNSRKDANKIVIWCLEEKIKALYDISIHQFSEAVDERMYVELKYKGQIEYLKSKL